MYSEIVGAYHNCYEDDAKACDWCNKGNEYRKKADKNPTDCSKYCSSTGTSGDTGSGTSSEGGGKLPIIPIAVGAVILIAVVGYFLMKK